MSPSWRLRTFQPGDEARIAELFERVFHRPTTPDSWRWKMGRSTPSHVQLAVDLDDRPIFHIAGLPRVVVSPEREHRILVAVDAMTDPEFRRRGLLTAGSTAAWKRWRDEGFDAVIGLPNEQYGSRIQALGWQPFFPLRWRILPMRPGRILARRLGLPSLPPFDPLRLLGPWRLGRPDPSIHLEDVDHVGEGVEALTATLPREGSIVTVRDSSWLNWRYFSHPVHDYRMIVARQSGQLEGYIVYRTDMIHGRRQGFVADLVSRRSNSDIRRHLLHEVLERLRHLDTEAVFTLSIPGTDLYRTFRQAGFYFGRRSFLVHGVDLSSDPSFRALRQPHHWWMTGGDFDIL